MVGPRSSRAGAPRATSESIGRIARAPRKKYHSHMSGARRDFLKSALLAGALAHQAPVRAAAAKPGMPGAFPGRVVAVEHPNCIVSDQYQEPAIEQMMHKGMLELTGAPGWPDAWRALFEPGDVVGIKVSPVGGPKLCSDAIVMHQILDGL